MTDQIAQSLYCQLSATTHVVLKSDRVAAAIAYAHVRAQWKLAGPEKRQEMDLMRSASHNAVIDACNILSRAMGDSNEDTSWRDALGNDRRSIGDFACHLQTVIALSAS